jgi:outer membrane protein OmpA-like peptidoglycan-associated protein
MPVVPGSALGIPMNRRVDIIVERPVKKKNSGTPRSMGDVDKLNPGDRIVLKNLNFIGGRHYLLPRSVPTLDSLYEMLESHSSMVIEIRGYVCCTDSMSDGADFDVGDNHLSVHRAQAIYHSLIERGIRSSRLSYGGFGGKRPVVYPEKTDADREANRRVEIRIVKK